MSVAEAPVFHCEIPGYGRFHLRPLCLPGDLPVLHGWVTRPYAAYWGLVGRSPAEVEAAYELIARDADVFLGFREGEPAFLVECYDPRRHAVAAHYEAQAGDRGMHVLVAPADRPVHGFAWAVFRVVMDFLFSDPAVNRIVVEPDIRNAKIHALNRRAGFRYAKMIELPEKTGHLAFCTREHYAAALAGRRQQHGRGLIDHLQPEIWATVNRGLVRKAIAELAHERVLCPRRIEGGDGWDRYELSTDRADVLYRFRARLLPLEHWDVDASSVQRIVAGTEALLDAVDFFLDVRDRLGFDARLLPTYLEEITRTLDAAAYKQAHQSFSAADLAHADFQEIESAMTEGHPGFIANSGRVGFDAHDHGIYAPEAAAPVRLVWLAVHRRHAQFTALSDVDYNHLMREQLGAETLATFEATLTGQGLSAEDYWYLPVHPWQWFNTLSMTFAADIAARDLVCLGEGNDVHRAQQSIRTFLNLDRPDQPYAKTALSVLNMGFMRGLSADYMRDTPAINEWLHGVVAADPYFAEQGFRLLREIAAVGYRSPRFEGAVPKSSPFRKMLAALWRESPVSLVRPGQRLMTMAALLHRDRDGIALVPQLIRASGLSCDAWIDRYLACYLSPLLHCLYQYDLAFMPHGENVILILDGYAPVGAFLKDTGEEVVLMDPSIEVPPRVERIRAHVPEELRVLSIFTDVFDGILRFLCQVLLAEAGYPEDQFWRRVAACVATYARRHPHLADKLARYDLFAPDFAHSCLNRLQLRNNLQMVDLTDPSGSLVFAERLGNPIARFRKVA